MGGEMSRWSIGFLGIENTHTVIRMDICHCAFVSIHRKCNTKNGP